MTQLALFYLLRYSPLPLPSMDHISVIVCSIRHVYQIAPSDETDTN